MAKVRKPKVPAAPPPASYIDAELVRIEAWARTGLEMAGLDPGRFAPISREAEPQSPVWFYACALWNVHMARFSLRRGLAEQAAGHAFSIAALEQLYMIQHYQPAILRGREFSAGQATRGRAGARKRWQSNGRAVLDKIIDHLRHSVDELGDPLGAKDLWPLLFDALDAEQLTPEEVEHPTDERKSLIKFTGGQISFGRFQNRLKP